jgi:hypothetical protein
VLWDRTHMRKGLSCWVSFMLGFNGSNVLYFHNPCTDCTETNNPVSLCDEPTGSKLAVTLYSQTLCLHMRHRCLVRYPNKLSPHTQLL